MFSKEDNTCYKMIYQTLLSDKANRQESRSKVRMKMKKLFGKGFDT